MKFFIAMSFGLLVASTSVADSLADLDTPIIVDTATTEVHSEAAGTNLLSGNQHHIDVVQANRELVSATKRLVWATWVLAFFAALAFLLSWGTFRVARGQSKRESRAYLTVALNQEGCNESSDSVFQAASLRISPSFRNHGRTPARDVWYTASTKGITRSAEGQRPRIDEEDLQAIRGMSRNNYSSDELWTISPGAEVSHVVVALYSSNYEQYKSLPEARRLPDGTQTSVRETEFCLYGTLTYSDVLGDTWEVVFAWYLVWLHKQKQFFPIEIFPHGQERRVAQHPLKRVVRFIFG